MNLKYVKGLFGEFLSAVLLMLKGYQILERRYKTKYGEIDIIAANKSTIVFVEVKFRQTTEAGFNAITQRQLARIINASEMYIIRRSKYQTLERRYDVILVSNWFSLKHITNVTMI